MFTLFFWKAALERAIKSAGQAGALVLGGVALTSLEDVVSIGAALGYAMAGAFVLSILTSMGSANIGNAGPSLANETLVVETNHDDWTEFDHSAIDEPRGGYATDQG